VKMWIKTGRDVDSCMNVCGVIVLRICFSVEYFKDFY
jgi:hypothetical protein